MDKLVQDVRERFKQIMAEQNTNPNAICGKDQNLRMRIARQISAPRKILNEEGKPVDSYAELTVHTVLLLAKAVPNLSMDWLIKGEGEPYLPLRERVITDEEAETLTKLVERVTTIEKQLRSIR